MAENPFTTPEVKDEIINLAESLKESETVKIIDGEIYVSWSYVGTTMASAIVEGAAAAAADLKIINAAVASIYIDYLLSIGEVDRAAQVATFEK